MWKSSLGRRRGDRLRGVNTGFICKNSRTNLKSPVKPRKDTRNLTDEEFMTQEIRRITNYFSDKPITASLAPKGLQLRQLTLKTFVHLVNFLVGHLDSTANITMTNYMEEIPVLMRKLGYPGTINSSWLKTANTQQSLPHVLGLLSWLVSVVEALDACPVDDICFQNEDTDDDDGMFPFANAKFYFDHFVSQYMIWKCNPDSVGAGLEKLINELCERNGFSQKDIDQLAAEVEHSKEQLNDPKKCAEREAIIELEKNYQALQDARKQQQIDYKVSIEECLNDAETQLMALERNCQKEEEALAKLHEQREAVHEQMSNQAMTPEQRDELIRNCEDLKKQIRNKEENVTVIQEENFKDDLCLSKIREQLRKKTQEYNNTILKEACFLPEMAGLLIEDNCLRPSAEEQLDHIAKELRELKAKLSDGELEMQEKTSNAKLLNTKIGDELSNLEEDKKRLTQIIQQKEADLEACVKRVHEEQTKLKTEISNLEREKEALLSSNSEKENKEKLEKLLEERDRALFEFEDFKKRKQESFQGALDRYTQHLTNITSIFEEHKARMEVIFEKFSSNPDEESD